MNIFKYFYCFVILFSASCSKEEMAPIRFTVPILNPDFTLRVHDQRNVDLLDPDSKGSYSIADIKIGIVNRKGDFIAYSDDNNGNKVEIKYLDELGYYLLLPTPIPTENKPLKVSFALQIGSSIDKFEVRYNPNLLPEDLSGKYINVPLPIETIWHNGSVILDYSKIDYTGELVKSSTPILIKNPKH